MSTHRGMKPMTSGKRLQLLQGKPFKQMQMYRLDWRSVSKKSVLKPFRIVKIYLRK